MLKNLLPIDAINIVCILILLSTMGVTSACRKHSSALPPPNDTSGKDSVNIIDTPMETNSAYDSASFLFEKWVEVYRDNVSITSIKRGMVSAAHLYQYDDPTILGLVIRVNSLKLGSFQGNQWWQYSTFIDSGSTPGYPIYDSARIQFIAPNGFKDLDYRMPYMPFYTEPIPYLLSKNGFNIPLVANNLAGADSVHISMSGVYFDSTLKITDCSILVDSAWIHQMCSSFPADALISIHAFKWFNVISHGKKYSILNTSTASYHVLVQ